MIMTPRERFIAALERRPLTGRVPHFELVFFLTMEALGMVHPSHRNYEQWDQMSETERRLHQKDMAKVFVATAEKYDHSAIFVHANPGRMEETPHILNNIREMTGDKYYIMLHGDATLGMPDGEHIEEFAYQMADDPESVHKEARRILDDALRRAEHYSKYKDLVDGFTLCTDYCFNTNPFFTPDMFGEFVAPYLAELIKAYRDMGFYVIKHTDGNIMPILDQIVQCNPHAVHSLDPQAGVDIANVRDLYGDKICLIGNVNCGLLQTGSEEEITENVKYSLREGMKSPGYIFSTSNCAYTGLPLERYELMHRLWQEYGNYPD